MSDTEWQSASQAPVVPERAIQGAETLGRDWSWVEATVWSERMLAALGNGVKGGRWFSLIDKVYRIETLKVAWQKVKGNAGAAGVDGQSVKQFEVRAEMYLKELSIALERGTYRPMPVRRVEISKGGGKLRPLGIPVVKDRIVQTALKFVLEPIFEREFLKMSYGFRPGLGCKDALREVAGWLKEGYTFVVDADLRSYFDTIAHARLMERVKEQVSDGRVLELIEAFLHQDIVKEMERWTPVGGTPQGAVISPLLANIYLHALDCQMKQKGYRMVRYADDFVVLCRSAEQAQAALVEVKAWVEANGLSLNAEKTHVGDCRQKGQGFEFLGYRFEAGRHWVRPKSLKALRERIRVKTKRTRGDSLAKIIEDLNPMVRGWFNYFKHAHSVAQLGIDGFVRRRLRAILRKQEKRPGMGRCLDDHLRWPNRFFATQGLFTITAARVLASQSR
ncbi:MAG TPA: group II intron reverse transcriptase/maturase [Candidatus Binatia bacterium]|nr:group II intron reverse transcriptase/maturase [Candidatus Binatia bacterium]